MKFLKNDHHGKTSVLGLALAGALLTGLLGLGLVSSPAVAGGMSNQSGSGSGDDGPGDDGSGGTPPGPFGPDEEVVGTLPSVGRKPGPPPPPPTRPGIYLIGQRQDVEDAMAYVPVGEDAWVESYPLTDNELYAVFYGEFTLDLDARLTIDGRLKVGLVSQDPEGVTRATGLTTEQLLFNTAVPAGGTFSMPIEALDRVGALDDGMFVLTASPTLGRDLMRLERIGGTIRLQQGGVRLGL